MSAINSGFFIKSELIASFLSMKLIKTCLNVGLRVTTDGLENARHEFTYIKVKELIQHQQKRYNWEFIFLGANMDAVEEADSLGIASEDAYKFEASETGVRTMYSMVSEAVIEKRRAPKT